MLAANSIPLVALLLLGGVVADRLPRAVVLVSSHLTAGATQGVVAWWFFRGGGDLTLLVVASGLNGAASAFTGPALRGILTQLVDREAIGRANALRATCATCSAWPGRVRECSSPRPERGGPWESTPPAPWGPQCCWR